MKTFYFEIVGEYNNYCGYEFFVEADNLADAWDIVADEVESNLDDVKCYGDISFAEAEIYGFDTY